MNILHATSSHSPNRNNVRRAAKIIVLSIVIIICALPATGYTQTSNARPASDAANGQDGTQQPSNSGNAAATGALPNSANNAGQAAPNRPMPAGQKGIPVTPAATALNTPLASSVSESQTTVPQNVLFEFLFNNMSILNQVAALDEKTGKHAMAVQWRAHDQSGAGLNDAEGQILQEFALDCLRALKEQDAKIRTSVEKDRAQRAPGVIGPTPPELVQLFEERKKIVNDHIERLREALGNTSFSKLDAYVHSSFHVEAIIPKPAAPSATEPEKSQKESR